MHEAYAERRLLVYALCAACAVHVLVCGGVATGSLLRRLSGSRLFWWAVALLAAANWAYLLTKA